jgi:hypothetical protein
LRSNFQCIGCLNNANGTFGDMFCESHLSTPLELRWMGSRKERSQVPYGFSSGSCQTIFNPSGPAPYGVEVQDPSGTIFRYLDLAPGWCVDDQDPTGHTYWKRSCTTDSHCDTSRLPREWCHIPSGSLEGYCKNCFTDCDCDALSVCGSEGFCTRADSDSCMNDCNDQACKDRKCNTCHHSFCHLGLAEFNNVTVDLPGMCVECSPDANLTHLPDRMCKNKQERCRKPSATDIGGVCEQALVCSQLSDCSPHATSCASGKCVYCASHNDCTALQKCTGGQCVATTNCTSSADCNSDKNAWCDSHDNLCKDCLSS